MSTFYPLKVKNIESVAKDAVAVTFDIPLQYIPLFRYKQGQYITLKLNINNENIIRSYSICTNPYSEKELKIAVKEVQDGKMSSYLNKLLKIGDTIEVMPPAGKFYTELIGTNQKQYVFFAGGSGITPILSIIKSTLYLEKQSRIILFYANKETDNIIFQKDIELLEKNNSNLKVFYIFDKAPNNYPAEQSGYLDENKISVLLNKNNALNADDFFICGPIPMMQTLEKSLLSLNINALKIHIEYFTAIENNNNAPTTNEPTIESNVTVILYGIETNFKLNSNGISILDAAIQEGVDAPFSCKGGVCSTCRAKIVEGKAIMKVNYALTDQEVADGYILTCQAHPTSEKIIVDYD